MDKNLGVEREQPSGCGSKKAMAFERGKFYRMRDGRKAECLATSILYSESVRCTPFSNVFQVDDSLVKLNNEGRCLNSRETGFDVLSEWADPVICWQNYYRTDSAPAPDDFLYPSKDRADKAFSGHEVRVALLEIDFTNQTVKWHKP